jgi:hypothetical protein
MKTLFSNERNRIRVLLVCCVLSYRLLRKTANGGEMKRRKL